MFIRTASVRDVRSLAVDAEVSEEEETAPDKRLRIAKEYLHQLEEQGVSSCSMCTE